MATATANSIFLDSMRGNREELVAASGTSILPGMLLRRTSANEANVHNVSGGNGPALLAVEDEYQDSAPTGGVTKTYAAGGPVFCEYVLPGSKRYVLLKASENVAIGDFLISDGAGLFIKTTGTPARQFCQVEEASNVGTNNLIKVRFF
jgi:hypothetical protein